MFVMSHFLYKIVNFKIPYVNWLKFVFCLIHASKTRIREINERRGFQTVHKFQKINIRYLPNLQFFKENDS